MPVLPSAVALDLAIGPTIASGEHISNYTAIQTAVNAIIAALNVGSGATPYLTGSGSTLTWAAVSQASLVTALPGSPVDGDECVLVDSLSAPTYAWRMKYVSAATTYKWYCVGGEPLVVTTAAASTRANTVYGDLADAATPTFTIPNAGDWLIGIEVNMNIGDSEAFCSPMMGATEAIDADAVSVAETGGSTVSPAASVSRTILKTAVSAATAVKPRFKSAAGTITAKNRTLTFMPRRIA